MGTRAEIVSPLLAPHKRQAKCAASPLLRPPFPTNPQTIASLQRYDLKARIPHAKSSNNSLELDTTLPIETDPALTTERLNVPLPVQDRSVQGRYSSLLRGQNGINPALHSCKQRGCAALHLVYVLNFSKPLPENAG